MTGIKNVVYHIDDVLIFGNAIKEHDATLRMVLGKIEAEGITINKKKCTFGIEEIKYLEHCQDRTPEILREN